MSYSYISPMLSIMGGLYPNDRTNNFAAVTNIFNIEVNKTRLRRRLYPNDS